jgi:hypothetical protein
MVLHISLENPSVLCFTKKEIKQGGYDITRRLQQTETNDGNDNNESF